MGQPGSSGGWNPRIDEAIAAALAAGGYTPSGGAGSFSSIVATGSVQIGGGLNMGGAAGAATGQIRWATGLGAISQLLGPTDQELSIKASENHSAYISGGDSAAGSGYDGIVRGGNGAVSGGNAQVYGGAGAIGGQCFVYAGAGTVTAGDTYVDAGQGPGGADGVLYLGTSSGYNSAIHLGQATVYTRVFGGLGMGGASGPSNGQIKWHTGLGVLTHLLGPTDQTLALAGAGGSTARGVTVTGGAATSGGGGPASLVGGAGFGSSAGGAANVTGGAGGATGAGASVTIAGGAGGATSGNAGSVTIRPGTLTSGTEGAVNICTSATQRLGFFGTAAIARQNQPAADAAAIIAALVSYGLFNP